MTGYYSQDDMIHEVDLREELDECIAENWIRMMPSTPVAKIGSTLLALLVRRRGVSR